MVGVILCENPSNGSSDTEEKVLFFRQVMWLLHSADGNQTYDFCRHDQLVLNMDLQESLLNGSLLQMRMYFVIQIKWPSVSIDCKHAYLVCRCKGKKSMLWSFRKIPSNASREREPKSYFVYQVNSHSLLVDGMQTYTVCRAQARKIRYREQGAEENVTSPQKKCLHYRPIWTSLATFLALVWQKLSITFLENPSNGNQDTEEKAFCSLIRL